MRLLFLFVTGLSFAQHHSHPPAESKPAELMPGVGPVRHTIQTSSTEAQKFFDQGLNLIYGFNHDEAERSFRQAALLDPKAVMPLWGVAYALGPNINLDRQPGREKAAYEAVQAAMRLTAQAPAHEQAYVEALAKRYSNNPKDDPKKLARDFASAMGELMRKYPDDLDAATLYAESLMDLNPWKLWTKDGKPAEDTLMIVDVLEDVLRRDPNHIGANHYYIHAVEASKRPERALSSAERLGKLAPAAGHLVHMPGHIYLQLGEYSRTVSTNVDAAAADERYLKATGVQGLYSLMYYPHNLHFVAVARAAQGRYHDAMEPARKMEAQVAPALKEMPMLEMFAVVPKLVQVQFARWDEVLAWPALDPKSGQYGVSLYGRTLAFAGTGKVKQAEAELVKLREVVAAIPPEVPFGATNTMRPVMEVALGTAEARLAWAKGDRESAVAKWRTVVETADGLAYDEPPAWYYPPRQSLGAALLLLGKAEEAEQVFREALRRNPRDGRLLFGLWKSLEVSKKPGAGEIRRQFEEAWKEAEAPLRVEDL